MPDLFSWSIDLGRWAGVRVRAHITLVLFVVIDLILAAFTQPQRFLPTLAWMGLLLLVLALHELGHLAAAAWRDAEPEDVVLWPLGNLVGPSPRRSDDNPWVLAGGLMVSGLLAIATLIALWFFRAQMILSPFGGGDDSGAPLVLVDGKPTPAHALSALWWAGWFGWLNWLIFVANLIPALPFDNGRIVRATIARPRLGIGRDAMIGPWMAHATAILLAVTGVLRLVFSGGNGTIVLLMLALLIELFVRVEAHLMEDGSFFDDGVFGYDFSEGYTSLESGAAKVRPARESALKRWRRRRSDQRRQRRAAQFAAEDRRLDEILDKLHHHGRDSLTEEENRFLVRVSGKIKKRPRA